jgi:predicted  nucleic acid-binding Zn-ribbon protein
LFQELSVYRQKLAEANSLNKQLKFENDTLQEELQDIRHEMEELQDQFRVDDADEFRQLQSELEIAAKNCRILQFKLRKLEKRNESLETEKILLQGKHICIKNFIV